MQKVATGPTDAHYPFRASPFPVLVMSFLTKALSPAVKEVRLFLCQTGQASAGARQFLLKSYPTLKQNNPDLPVLIREVNGTPARAFARFEYGVEKNVVLENLSQSEVEKKMSELLASS